MFGLMWVVDSELLTSSKLNMYPKWHVPDLKSMFTDIKRHLKKNTTCHRLSSVSHERFMSCPQWSFPQTECHKKATLIIKVLSATWWEKPKRRRSCRLEFSDSCHMSQLLSTVRCLRESQFIFPEGWTTCDIWQWSIRHFIQLFRIHSYTQTKNMQRSQSLHKLLWDK